MESQDLVSLIDVLDDNLDDLEEVLEPLLSTNVTDAASKMPLMDKAHFYVFMTYAIESVLFCEQSRLK